MAAEETLPYGRSSSRASRVVLDPAHEQRSFFGHKSSKKSQQKAVSDKLLWFSPVHSPLLSPAREKSLQIAKKKVRNSSIFSIQTRAKGSVEAPEEPSSPKVSCIGQVRAYKKGKDPFVDSSNKGIPLSKPGSMSPARFFASPGRASKWGSLFGSRKDSCSTPTSSRYGGDYQLEKQDTWAAVDGYFDRYTHDVADSLFLGEACSSAAANCYSSQKTGTSVYEKCYDSNMHEKLNNGQNPFMHDEPNDADTRAGPEESLREQRCHGKPPVSKQRLTYEELPSLHGGPSIKPNMKISVEVVPETWLCRNVERLRSYGTSQLTRVPERSYGTCSSREDVQGPHEEEINIPVSPCRTAHPHIGAGEGCVDCLVSQSICAEDNSDFDSAHAGLASVDNTTCTALHVDCERKNDTQFKGADEASVLLPVCTSAGVCRERSMEPTSSGNKDGASGCQVDKYQARNDQKPKGGVDGEKHQILLESSELINTHRRLRRVGPDVGKENCIAIPQLLETKFPSVQPNEDGKCVWSVFKGGKSDAFSAQPFSALIVVGYDQSISSKDSVRKVTHDEELLKGILEVGRLSFHGTGKYFQVLKGDAAAFIRSRSATSQRTVITLQRCNSDPCRSSY